MPTSQSPQEPDEAREPLSLTVGISDFGPINEGEITLKPLTVFIGPNNSGKSYAAMLVNSILSARPGGRIKFRPSVFSELLSSPEIPDAPQLQKEWQAFVAKAMELEEGERITAPLPLLERLAEAVFQHDYTKFLREQITRSYGCELADLVAIDRDEFALRINTGSDKPHVLYNGQLISLDRRPDQFIEALELEVMPIPEQDFQLTIRVVEDETSETFTDFMRRDPELVEVMLYAFVSREYDDLLWPGRSCRSYYLPAARSGILQAHRALAAALVETAAYAGLREHPEIPQLSGVVVNFISTLLRLDPQSEGHYFEAVSEFEQQLLSGRAEIGYAGKHLYPELLYNYRGTQMPLHRTSSTVSELAPLFLYLKYVIAEDSVLIIEEPETHLHPANQRILAQLLVRLIREGLTVLITTHSEFLLEQLSNFILLSKIDPEVRRDKYRYGEEDYLDMDEVAAYLFRPEAGERGGHVIESVEIDEEDGISQEEFVKVHEVLYKETLRLYSDLSDDDDDGTDEP
jgi:predicted ATPase